MDTSELTLVQILDAGITRLQTKQWRQNEGGGEEGPNCGLGAPMYGAVDLGCKTELHWTDPRMEQLLDRLKKHLGLQEVSPFLHLKTLIKSLNSDPDVTICPSPRAIKFWPFTLWNDEPDRTVEDVILAFKAVRYELEAEANAQT